MSVCLIFDLDGTLVDSESLCNQAFLNLLPDLDESVETLVTRYRGQKLAKILDDIELRLGQSLPPDFEVHYRSHVADLFSSELKPTAGVCDFLDASLYPRCVASSGPMPKIMHALTVSGLKKYFNNIYSSYEVGIWKPDPGLFLHAAKSMNFLPEECIVIEDSAVGIEAAKAAGMKALHFTSTGSFTDATPADYQFAEMAELPTLLIQLMT